MSKNTLSPSGARIRGDDYQHLFAWCQILRALQQGSGVTAIGIKDPDPAVGNADDVTVYRNIAPNEFYQVKSSVNATRPVNCQWLLTSSPSGRSSILQRLYRAWQDLTQDGRPPKLFLVTNKAVDPADPVIVLRDGRDGTVAEPLSRAKGMSRAGKMRCEIARHLNVSEGELIEFLKDICFRVDRLHQEWEEHAAVLMYALGLRYDARAIQDGINAVHRWVTDGRRILTLDEIRYEVESLGLKVAEPAPVLLVQAIDHDPMPEAAKV